MRLLAMSLRLYVISLRHISLKRWITKVTPTSWGLMDPPLPPLLVKTTLVVHQIVP